MKKILTTALSTALILLLALTIYFALKHQLNVYSSPKKITELTHELQQQQKQIDVLQNSITQLQQENASKHSSTESVFQEIQLLSDYEKEQDIEISNIKKAIQDNHPSNFPSKQP